MAQTGARSLTGRRNYGVNWLPWVAFLLLVAIAVAVVLIVANVNDENDAPGIDLQDNEVSNETLAPLAPSTSARVFVT